ncbi:MAG: YdcF family protein [Planctomycetota bacterium]
MPVPSLARRLGAALVTRTVRVLALFAAVNASLEVVSYGEPRFWWWIGLQRAPAWLGLAWLAAFCGSVLLWAYLPSRLRPAARLVVASAAAVCVLDAGRAWASGAGGEWPPLLSAAAALAHGLWAAFPPARADRPGPWRIAGNLLGDAAVAAAGLVITCVAFGAMDQRRPADAIVVFGAGVKGDGTPSPSLADRTRTGCELWRAGLARHLVFSGGHGDGVPVSEPVSMQRFAAALGVPEAATVLDETGINTLATVRTCQALARERGWRRFLMVSHDYHLLRIKMFSERAGLQAFTVPAREGGGAERRRQRYARELAAIAYYYFLPQMQG